MARDDLGRGEMGRDEMRHGEGARFRFQRGESRVAVKCADDEPRVCVDATLLLLDKIMAAR